MSAHNSRTTARGKAKTAKLKKPRADFPLNIHRGSGYWCKKVHSKVYYFGKVADDPKGVAALEEWLRVKDYRLAKKEPPDKDASPDDRLTVEDLCFKFLEFKEALKDNGELSPRTFAGYLATSENAATFLGRTRAVVDLKPDDFGKLRAKLADKWAAVGLRNEMQRVRSLFKFAYDQGMIAAPIRFGQSFTKPKPDVVRRDREKHRNEHGDRMFEAADLRNILDEAGQPLKSMILLAANCAFGQSDLSALPIRAVDLKTQWVNFARIKTGIPRRIPLWPETVASIQEWLTRRPKPKDAADEGLLFLTVRGARFVKVNEKGSPKDAIGQEFEKVLKKLKLKREGVGFYALRHGFETMGGETGDQIAVDTIMGHVPHGMSAVYRERISDERLRRVTNFVRAWLYPPQPAEVE